MVPEPDSSAGGGVGVVMGAGAGVGTTGGIAATRGAFGAIF